MKISVVILNFNRPDYIKKYIIPAIKNNVDEILISHGKKDTYFEHPDVTSFKHYGEMNNKFGLSRRFLTALESKNENIIIMDDDIIPDKKTIEILSDKISKDDKRIHGIYGRDLKKSYNTDNFFGEVDVVLTRLLVTTKSMCQYYIDNFRNFETIDVKNSKPYWNGEDILFSLLSIKKYGNYPLAHDLKHTNRLMNYLDFTSISLDNSHLEYRKKISKEFINKLDIENKIKDSKDNYKVNELIYFFRNSVLITIFYSILLLITFYYIIKWMSYSYGRV